MGEGPNVEYIVFRNLLNHTSGLTTVDIIDFGLMKGAIAVGISLDLNAANHLGGYCYQNLNYCLCRVLLAVINSYISRSALFPPLLPGILADLNDTIWDLVTIMSYTQYSVTNVSRPAGCRNTDLSEQSDDPAIEPSVT